jgi:hypothetical protein
MDFKGDKICSTPSFGGEVKPLVPLQHVKEPYEHDRYSSAKFSGHVSHPCFICFATRCLLALLTDVSGGWIKINRTRLIVGLITSHRTYLTIMKTRKGRSRPNPGCSATNDDMLSCSEQSWVLKINMKIPCCLLRNSHVEGNIKHLKWWEIFHQTHINVFLFDLYNLHR